MSPLLSLLFSCLLTGVVASAQDLAAAPAPPDVQVVLLRDVRGVLDIVQGPDGDLLLGVQGSQPREVGLRLISYDPAVRWEKYGTSQPVGADSGFDQELERTSLSGAWTGPAVAFRADGSVVAMLSDKSGHRWWFGASTHGKLDTGHRLTQLRGSESIEELHLQPDGTLVGVGTMYVPGEPDQHPNLWPKLRIFHLERQGHVTDFQVADRALHDKAPVPVVHPDDTLWFYQAVKPGVWHRWDPAGTRDLRFEAALPPGLDTAEAWAALPDGSVVASVRGTRLEPRPGAECGNDVDKVGVYALVRFAADGAVARQLIPPTSHALRIHQIQAQADGGLILVGDMATAALWSGTQAAPPAGERCSLARLAPDGSLDVDFTARWVGVAGVKLALPLSDGRVAVAGEPMQGLAGLEAPLMVIVPGQGGPAR